MGEGKDKGMEGKGKGEGREKGGKGKREGMGKEKGPGREREGKGEGGEVRRKGKEVFAHPRSPAISGSARG